jgi:hypothetical protein
MKGGSASLAAKDAMPHRVRIGASAVLPQRSINAEERVLFSRHVPCPCNASVPLRMQLMKSARHGPNHRPEAYRVARAETPA